MLCPHTCRIIPLTAKRNCLVTGKTTAGTYPGSRSNYDFWDPPFLVENLVAGGAASHHRRIAKSQRAGKPRISPLIFNGKPSGGTGKWSICNISHRIHVCYIW